jgi:putative transposon-encoded protein
MLLKKLKFILLLLIAPMLFVACDDDDDDVSFDVNLLKDTKWVTVKSTIVFNSNVTQIDTSKSLDTYIQFHADDSYTQTIMGQLIDFNAKWSGSGNKIVVTALGNSASLEVIKLTSSELILEGPGNFINDKTDEEEPGVKTEEYKSLNSLQ